MKLNILKSPRQYKPWAFLRLVKFLQDFSHKSSPKIWVKA
jgi:hypothetical protein